MDKFRQKQQKLCKPYLLQPLNDEYDLDENRISNDEYKNLAVKAKKDIKINQIIRKSGNGVFLSNILLRNNN